MSNPYRSMLFVPADRPERYAKALLSGADAVICDLEDAVAQSAKADARRMLCDACPPRPERRRPIFVRVNDITTTWWQADVEAALEVEADGIMLPKAERAEDAARVASMIAGAESSAELIVILETAIGLADAREIMAQGPWRSNIGAGDLSRDLSLTLDRDETILAPYRAGIVLAARAAGAPAPLDTVFGDLREEEGLAASARRAAAMGFGGKLVIHPSQVGPVNQAFTPSSSNVSRARKIVAAFEAAERQGSASINVDGEFVDYPVAERARRVLSLAELYDA